VASFPTEPPERGTPVMNRAWSEEDFSHRNTVNDYPQCLVPIMGDSRIKFALDYLSSNL
jgi:hypothetical protein